MLDLVERGNQFGWFCKNNPFFVPIGDTVNLAQYLRAIKPSFFEKHGNQFRKRSLTFPHDGDCHGTVQTLRQHGDMNAADHDRHPAFLCGGGRFHGISVVLRHRTNRHDVRFPLVNRFRNPGVHDTKSALVPTKFRPHARCKIAKSQWP